MKKQIHKIRLSLALPVIAGTMILAPVTVFAQSGSDDGTSGRRTSDSSGRSSTQQTEVSTTQSTETENETEVNDATSLREKAQELLQSKRKERKEHTVNEKQKSCEARAANINKRAAKYSEQAQKHLDVFNKIFTKVQAFHDDKQLTVTDYDTLVAAATAKQTVAQDAVAALKALDVDIDCTQNDPATTVAILKTTTANARTALHEYRKAIKDVVVALKGASTAEKDKSSTDGSPETTDKTTETTTDTTTQGGAQ